MPSLVDFVKTKVKKRLRKKPVAEASPDEEVGMPLPSASTKDPYELDQNLEDAAAPNRPPIAPSVRGVMKRSGLLSMIRNRSNQQMVDPEDQNL